MSDDWRPQKGEVVLVRFPFLEVSGKVKAKLRPAVIVSSEIIHETTADVLIVAISSRPISRPIPTDYQIVKGTPEYAAAGLKKTSWVKVSNVANIPRAAVSKRLGRLTPSALKEVDARLKLAFNLSSFLS